MLRVGLTGGVGSGKTLVANMFAELDAPVIDTDILAREVVAPGTEGFSQVVSHFGDDILSENGKIDRKALKKIVFDDPDERVWLEKTLHPLIREKVKSQIDQLDADYCIIVIPLLAETWPHPLVDRVLVVDAPEELQIQRVTERDYCSPDVVKHILDAQASRTDRLAIANDVIVNDRDIETLREEVARLHSAYSV